MATTDTLVRGDSRTYYDDVSVNGIPLDLTGYSAWFTVKYAPTDLDAAAAIRKGMTGGLSGVTLITGPTSGILNRVKITLSPSDTSSLPAKQLTLYYDVQIKSPTGDIFTITRGELLVLPDITTTTT